MVGTILLFLKFADDVDNANLVAIPQSNKYVIFEVTKLISGTTFT